MGKSFVIPYEIYPFDLFVSIQQTDEELRAELEKMMQDRYHDQIDELIGEYSARTVMFEGGQTVIRFKGESHLDYGIVAHEVFHAVHFLMDRIGVLFSIGSAEAYAYMLQYLVNKIIEYGQKQENKRG